MHSCAGLFADHYHRRSGLSCSIDPIVLLWLHVFFVVALIECVCYFGILYDLLALYLRYSLLFNLLLSCEDRLDRLYKVKISVS